MKRRIVLSNSEIKYRLIYKLIAFSIAICFGTDTRAQMHSGKIVYERKTNLYKKFKDDDVTDWLKESDKMKVDTLELYFNDSLSLFKPQDNELKEYMSWATAKNTVYQNFNQNTRLTQKSVWGEKVLIADTLYHRTWKITDSKRNISGYDCRKAIWQENDSTRIYAWYTDAISASVGPESFYGLPGAILGLATEDGGIIYFAKRAELQEQKPSDLIPPKTKDKIYNPADLRKQLEKSYGKEKWGKAMIKNVFGYW